MSKTLKTIAVIPARMESSRFPGKPLAKILGLEMIVHCMKRVQLSDVDEVFIATCNEEIRRVVEAHGGHAVMTANTHERCTDRVFEAVQNLKIDAKAIVIVQGDEPLVVPQMISESAGPILSGANIACTNLISRIETEEEFLSRNTIKVIVDSQSDALYMSRKPIPDGLLQSSEQTQRWKQVCVMSFSPESLSDFCRLPAASIEKLESIDMNRFIYHGRKVRCVETKHSSQAVDTLEDLKHVESLMRNDSLMRQYT